MTPILIATDFSSKANHTISYALQLFKYKRTNFYFIHAYTDVVYDPFYNVEKESFEEEKKAFKKSTENKLFKLIKEIKERTLNPKHLYDAIALLQSLVNALNNFIDIKNIDLIVMGAKGKAASSSITFGSNTVPVFKYIKCPVLAIPEGYENGQPKKILFPSGYMFPYKTREFKLLNTLAAQVKAKIHRLNISVIEDVSLRQLEHKKFLKESLPHALLSFVITGVENRAKAILTYIKENDMDFLVMLNSRHSFLEDMLYRSTLMKSA